MIRFLFLFLMGVSSTSWAFGVPLTYPKLADNSFGVGAVIGTTTGFTFKYNRDAHIAYDATLGWGSADHYRLSGDILWQKPRIFLADREAFDGYFGLGGRLRDRGENHDKNIDRGVQLGARAIGGIRYLFRDPRVEVFTEIGLVFDFIPATDADFEIGIGARYFF